MEIFELDMSKETIAIVATARKVDREKLEYARSLIESRGYNVVYAPNLFKEQNQFSGTDRERADDVNWAFENSEVGAVLCFRGGYGTVRILELLDKEIISNNPKWLMGYSDVTALHNYLNIFSFPSVHSSMPVNFGTNSKEALDSIFNVLEGNEICYQFISTSDFNRDGVAKGEIVGGNLSVLYSLAGTKYDLDTNEKILFIEDLDEYLYHIDRIMMNFKLSGKLSHLKGLIVGGMTDMHDNEIPFGKNAVEIISNAVKEYDYPVCFDFPGGHINDNRAIVLGKDASLIVKGETVIFSQK